MDSNLFMLRRKASSSTPDSSEDFQVLDGVDNAVDSFLSMGKVKKAFGCMNQALKIRTDIYGETSKEALEYIGFMLTRTCFSCSGLIEKGKIQTCIEVLRNLLILANNYPVAQISEETCDVYNTLSCALRKCGKPKIAKKYAMKALTLANSYKTSEKVMASIYLNLCAIFSSLGEHKEASINCSQAVQLAQEYLLNLKLLSPEHDFKEEVAVLAVAYHNLGVEEEYLKHYEEALAWYHKAIYFLQKHSHSAHEAMLEEFKRSYADAQKTCKKKFQKIRLERSLKDGFFAEPSYSGSEQNFKFSHKKLSSSKDSLKDFSQPMIPRIKSISKLAGTYKRDFRSESSDSMRNRTSERHRKLLELDSDIRELDNLGMLEHEKELSGRSKNSFRGLSPIHKESIKVRGGKVKTGETRAEYKEKIEKNSKKEDSVRRRKVIRQPSDEFFSPKKKQNIPAKHEVFEKQADFQKKIEIFPEKKADLPKKIEIIPEKKADPLKNIEIIPEKKTDYSKKIEIIPEKKADLPKKIEIIPGKNSKGQDQKKIEKNSKEGSLNKISIEKSGKVDQILLNAVIRIQSFFKARRLKRWYKEVKKGALFGTMLKCEKMINKLKYLVSFSIKKKEKSLCVLIEAQPMASSKVQEPAKYTLYEVCSMLNAWNTRDFESRKSELLIYTTIEKGKIILKKTDENRLELLYQGSRQLNNMFTYQISIYNIVNYLEEESILIDGKPLKKSPPIVRAFIITKKEIASILRIKKNELQRKLDVVLGLIIIEGEGELTLSRRNLSDHSPIINISATFDDTFTDKYKKYEVSHRESNKIIEKPLSIVFGNNELDKAAVNIQKVYKGKKERKNFLGLKKTISKYGLVCSVATLNNAVLLLQRFARKWKIRKNNAEKQLKEKEENAVVLLQSYTRGWLIRKQFPGLIPHDRMSSGQRRLAEAALEIQSRFRGWKARKECNNLKSLNAPNAFAAILLIQKAIKRWLLRKKAQKKSEEKKIAKKPVPQREKPKTISRSAKMKAILIIQKFIKGWKQRKLYQKMKESAINIQKHFRGWQVRNSSKKKKNFFIAVSIIQRAIRKWLEKRKKNKNKKPINKKEAAVIIQKNIKARAGRKAYLELKQLEKDLNVPAKQLNEAVMVMQKNFRGAKARKEVKQKKAIRDHLNTIPDEKLLKSVQVIQSNFRANQIRKDFLLLISTLKLVRPGVTGIQLQKAIITIQKYVKGWKVRKLYGNVGNSQSKKYYKAVITVQRFIRGWKARKEFENLKRQKVILISAVMIGEKPFVVSVSESMSQFIIKAMDAQLLTSIYIRIGKKNQKSNTLPLRLALKKGNLKLLEHAQKPQKFQFLLLTKKKTIEKTDFIVEISLEPSSYFVNFIGKTKSIQRNFPFAELFDRYSEKIQPIDIFDDIIIINEKIDLEQMIVLTKKSKNVRNKLYSILMYKRKETLVFNILHGPSDKKRISIDIKKAIDLTGISSGLINLGNYIIEKCMFFYGEKVNIVYTKQKIDLISAVTKIQAAMKGKLVRKQLAQPNLILCVEKVFNTMLYKLYCYYYSQKFQIKACLKNESLSLVIERKLAPHQILNFLRKNLIPNLFITETSPPKLVYRPQSGKDQERVTVKRGNSPILKNPEKSGKKVHAPLKFTSPKAANSSFEQPKTFKFENKPKTPYATSQNFVESKTIENFEKFSNAGDSDLLSSSGTPTIKLRKRHDMEYLSHSSDFSKILMKSGVNISGIYLIVTMQLTSTGIFIQAQNESRLIQLDLHVKTKRVQNCSEKDLENLCSELLSQLKIISNIEGKMALAIMESAEEDKNEVIYRRSHYISSRYFIVTIFENFRGVYLEAEENDKNMFNMKLGRRRVGNSQKVQEELSDLVKKLKIQVVLGQEILVLSAVS